MKKRWLGYWRDKMRDITSLIVQKLDAAHEEIPVYREEMKGGFSEPSFFVQRISMNVDSRPFNQQDRLYRYHIIYFPDPVRPKENMDNMAEWLAENMQVLETVGSLISREIQPLENELHFVFAIKFNARAEETANYMGELEIEGGLKRGN